MRLAAVPLAVLPAVLSLALLCSPAGSARLASATISVPSVEPATVIGRGFHAREYVRVRIQSTQADASRRIRASATGRFTVRFPGVALDSCTVWVASSVGSKGSRATLKSLPRSECPPPLQP